MSTKPKTKQTARRNFTAKQKCEAVLAIWSERRRPAEVCRELEIPWQQLNNWQDVAMKAMMSALDSKRGPGEEKPPSLSPRMEKLLAKADAVVTRRSRAEARLASIQKTVEQKKNAATASSSSA